MAQLPISSGPKSPSPDPIRRTGAAEPARKPEAESPAFRALLERLQKSAQELERTSETVADADHLAGAVDQARESLTDALSLSDQLLEAYRAAEHQAPDPETKDGDA